MYVGGVIWRVVSLIQALAEDVPKQREQTKEWDFKFAKMDFPANHKATTCSV